MNARSVPGTSNPSFFDYCSERGDAFGGEYHEGADAPAELHEDRDAPSTPIQTDATEVEACFCQFADERYLSDKAVAERYEVSRQTIWRWAKGREGFPAPIQITPGTSRWRLSELIGYEKATIEGVPAGAVAGGSKPGAEERT